MGALRAPPKEGQLFKQAFVKVGRLKELASRGCPPTPPQRKGPDQRGSGSGGGGTLQPDPGLTVALGYKKRLYITFSGTTKPRTHTPEPETVKEKTNQKGETETTGKA